MTIASFPRRTRARTATASGAVTPLTLTLSLLGVGLLVLALLVSPAKASQKDGRLDMLFDQLQMVEDHGRARVLMNRIWTLWTATDDKETSSLMNSGVDAMSAGDYATALDFFDQVTTADPEFAEGWNKRATVYFIIADYEKSVADIQKTLALEPRHFGALSGLGLIYMRLEQYEPAIRAFEAALAVNPHLSDVHLNLEIARKRLKEERI